VVWIDAYDPVKLSQMLVAVRSLDPRLGTCTCSKAQSCPQSECNEAEIHISFLLPPSPPLSPPPLLLLSSSSSSFHMFPHMRVRVWAVTS
jgi:hypothetical protein